MYLENESLLAMIVSSKGYWSNSSVKLSRQYLQGNMYLKLYTKLR